MGVVDVLRVRGGVVLDPDHGCIKPSLDFQNNFCVDKCVHVSNQQVASLFYYIDPFTRHLDFVVDVFFSCTIIFVNQLGHIGNDTSL